MYMYKGYLVHLFIQTVIFSVLKKKSDTLSVMHSAISCHCQIIIMLMVIVFPVVGIADI